MSFGAIRLRTIVSVMGLLVATMTAVSIPVSYAVVGYIAAIDSLSYKAQLNAGRVAKYIYAHGEMWKFHRLRLEELIELPIYKDQQPSQKILDSNGSIVVALDLGQAFPRLSRTVPITVAGEVVGFHEITLSLRPEALNALIIGLFSSVLGACVYLTVRWFPLRVLDRTLDDLATVNDEISQLNLDLEKRVMNRTNELREAQEKLLHKEQLSALGRLIATVAHELRNPLGVIRNSMVLIRNAFADKEDLLARPINRIERSVERCDRIINDLLDYTRQHELHYVEENFDEWLAGVVKEQNIPADITVHFDCGANLKRVKFDPERLRQVIINLIDNASQALADRSAGAGGSTIDIRTRMTDTFVEIDIQDNGLGIPADILPKIFELLFTTKSYGNGLGLPMVKKIVEAHGGSIEMSSEVGKGTLTQLRLPLEQIRLSA